MIRRHLFFCLLIFISPLALGKLPDIKTYTAGWQHHKGLFDVYYHPANNRVYLRIDRFNQPFIFQSSLPYGMGSNDIGLDRGQLGDTRLVEFQRFGDKVLLDQLNTDYRADTNNPAEKASVDEAFADSVLVGLPIVAADKQAVLVDYTDFLLSDIHHISNILALRHQGHYHSDKSKSGVYTPRLKTFPDNVELESVVTFTGNDPGNFVRQVTPEPDDITVHLHHSLIKLPDDGYQSRAFTPYSGYQLMEYQDYATAIDQPMTKRFIPRHRLQKKHPNAASSEAVKPIIYYLDPGIPEPVRSALREGASWWNQAFTAIGYKHAFQVKDLPADADPMDVRYNVIQWVHRATRGWSYGSSVVDPRTGEIIKGHVTLGSLRVRQDFLIALGLTSPFKDAQSSTEAQKQMALARIRQLAAHEVGHTLGLAHNFAASADGFQSVMDYPHPYLYVKNHQVKLDKAYATGLGKWDMYTIAYGYKNYPNPQAEQQGLKKLVNQTRASGLHYLSDRDARPGDTPSALGHLWDNGPDPVAELKRLSNVRKVALDNFGIHSIASGTPLSSLEETLVPIYLLHRYQVQAAAKLIGGLQYSYELKGDNNTPKGAMPVSAKRQDQALKQVLATISPQYLALRPSLLKLIPPKAFGYSRNRESFISHTGLAFDPLSAAAAAAGYSLQQLLQPARLNRLLNRNMMPKGGPDISMVIEHIINATIKAPFNPHHPAVQLRINYVALDKLVKIAMNNQLAPEGRAMVQARLIALNSWLDKHKEGSQQRIMASWLHDYLDTGKWTHKVNTPSLPPGSPI